MKLTICLLTTLAIFCLVPSTATAIDVRTLYPPMPKPVVITPEQRKELKQMQVARRVAAAGATQTVALIVDSAIYDDLAEHISNYVNDVQAEHPVCFLTFHDQLWSTQTFEQVREYIHGLWTTHDIKGAILVGLFPVMEFAVEGQGSGGLVAVMGYEDLDGAFLDIGVPDPDNPGSMLPGTVGDGIYDHHVWQTNGTPFSVTNDVTLEIWCALMRPYGNSYTPSVRQQLADYFAKLHRYYNHQMAIPKRGIAYVDHDWGYCITSLTNALGRIYTNDNIAAFGAYKCGFDGQTYMEQWANGFELGTVWAHSSSRMHQFNRHPWVNLYREYLTTQYGPGVMVAWLWACHSCDYLESPNGCLGQHYTFEGIGQTCVGCAMSYGTPQIDLQIEAMADGDSLGDAFHSIMEYRYQHNSAAKALTSRFLYCQVLFGNPFVYASASRDMSIPACKVTGFVSDYYGDPARARLTALRGGNVYGIIRTGPDGTFEIPNLPTGAFDVLIESLSGAPEPGVSYTLVAPGQHLSNQFIEMSTYGFETNDWHYVQSGSLPAGWLSLDCDMSGFPHAPAPFGRQWGYGTYVSNAPDGIFIRKTFVVDNLAPGHDVYLYTRGGTDDIVRVRLNSGAPPLSSTGGVLPYWTKTSIITSRLVPGTNVLVLCSDDYIDVACPVYSEPVPEPVALLAVLGLAGAAVCRQHRR